MKLINRGKGFTLVELMVILVIVGILAIFAVPSFQGMMERSRFRGDLGRLTSSISWARAEAIRTQSPVIVQPTGGSWKNGWMVFIDANGNGAYDSGDTELKTEGAMHTSITVAGSTRVTINPSGMMGVVPTVATLSIGSLTQTVSIQMNRVKVS